MNDRPDALTALVQLIEPATDHLAGHLLAGTAHELTQAIVAAEPPRRRWRRRVLKVSAAGLGLALAAAGTAAAVQALQSPAQQVQTFCNVPGEGPTDIIGPTGDPVSDCSTWWRHRLGTEPPALSAYQDTHSQIQVVPADQVVPGGWRALPGGVVQDPEQLQLNEALGDAVGGLLARCFDQPAAAAKARELVTASDFHGWPVSIDNASLKQNPAPNCWAAFANPRTHQVIVSAVPPLKDGFVPQWWQLAESLRGSLTQCWSMQTALVRVHDAIARSGFSAAEARAGVEVRQVPTPGAHCTTVHMGGGGSVILTLRGPAA